MTDPPKFRHRWNQPTPGRFVVGLLALEGFLLLSERFHWFSLNEHKGWTVLVALAAGATAVFVLLLWFLTSLLFRWRFQYGVRDLFVLVLAVAVPCSWLATQMRDASRQREAVKAIEEAGGSVSYDYPDRSAIAASGGDPFATPQPCYIETLLGVDFLGNVDEADVPDAAADRLDVLRDLQWLRLRGKKGRALPRLDKLLRLRELHLSDSWITDAGLEQLAGLAQLKELDLDGCAVTDAGLEHLRGLKRLRKLDLWETHVTEEGVRKLQQALPNCEIIRQGPLVTS